MKYILIFIALVCSANSKELNLNTFIGYDFSMQYDTLINKLKTDSADYSVGYINEKRKDTTIKFKVVTVKNYKFNKYFGYLSIYTLNGSIDKFVITIHNTEQTKPDKSFNNNIDKILNKLDGKRQFKSKVYDVIKFDNAGLVFDIDRGTFSLDILNFNN